MMTRFSESRPPALIQRLFISPLLAILCLVNVASAQGLPPGVRVSNDVPYGRENATSWTCICLRRAVRRLPWSSGFMAVAGKWEVKKRGRPSSWWTRDMPLPASTTG